MATESDTFLLWLCILLPFLLYADMIKRRRSKPKESQRRREIISMPPVTDSINENSTHSPLPVPTKDTDVISVQDVHVEPSEMELLDSFIIRYSAAIQSMDITQDKMNDLKLQLFIKKLSSKFSDRDLYRFLIARKGSVEDAKEAILATIQWRLEHFPIKRSAIQGPLNTGCFFFHGKARDGSPVFHFRNALYNKDAGSPLQYTLAIAYAIDHALRRSTAHSVVVFVHTGHVEGAINGPADFSFIKPFVKTFSDNYPERLNSLIMYPFPWYGRASWSVIRMFIDKRTQEKVQLLAAPSDQAAFCLPERVFEIIDKDEIPVSCGGASLDPIEDLLSTIDDIDEEGDK